MTISKSTRYHHGNLREALLDAAITLIREQGADKLSMRKLAEHVGVSRSALYHHYQDKNHLLCDIACDGFIELEQMMLLAHANSKDSIRAQIQAYVDFARNNTEQYSLMFGSTIWKSGQEPTRRLRAVSAKAFKSFVSNLPQQVKQNTSDHGSTDNNAANLRLAQLSWATLHGICMFVVDGIYTDDKVIDEMLDYAAELTL